MNEQLQQSLADDRRYNFNDYVPFEVPNDYLPVETSTDNWN